VSLDLYLKKKKSQQCWGCGRSSRVQGPEFKPQYCQKKGGWGEIQEMYIAFKDQRSCSKYNFKSKCGQFANSATFESENVKC
jgi:hypothetical protein